MQLTCEGCGAVLAEDTEDALFTAMKAHGAAAHANLWDGKTPEQIKQLEAMMDIHVRQMIADQN